MHKYIVDGISGYSFHLVIKGVDGKPLPHTIAQTGQQKYVNNRPVYIEEQVFFEKTPVDPKKPMQRACYLIVEKDEGYVRSIAQKYGLPVEHVYNILVEKLDSLANDPASGIETSNAYSQRKNPQAFAEAQRRAEVEKELEQRRQEAKDATEVAKAATEKLAEVETAKSDAEARERQKDEEIERMKMQLEKLTRKPGRPPKAENTGQEGQ